MGAAGGEEEADELELSSHGPTIPGGSVSSSGGGGGYYPHGYYRGYDGHPGYHHHNGGASGGGSTPTGGNGNGGGGGSTNVPRGRLPAVLTGSTQESFVNWLRLHTQLRQDASIRNALRAVNKFLRAVRACDVWMHVCMYM